MYRLADEEYRRGYLAPSMFTAYHRCARRLWIEAREGRLVTKEELFWILRGRAAEVLWREEHQGFEHEIHLVDEEERVSGIIDALRVEGNRVIVVELKSSHRVSLGHKLQIMMYARLVSKALAGTGRRVEAYLVYRHGVKKIQVNSQLLRRYAGRVRAAIEHKIPPPPPPDTRHCDTCPWRAKCRKMPRTDWDEWLLSIGDYPKGPQCMDCLYRSFCRAFRASTGKYPCESSQKPIIDRELAEKIIHA